MNGGSPRCSDATCMHMYSCGRNRACLTRDVTPLLHSRGFPLPRTHSISPTNRVCRSRSFLSFVPPSAMHALWCEMGGPFSTFPFSPVGVFQPFVKDICYHSVLKCNDRFNYILMRNVSLYLGALILGENERRQHQRPFRAGHSAGQNSFSCSTSVYINRRRTK